MICAACPDYLHAADAHDDHEADCPAHGTDIPVDSDRLCSCDRQVHPECCSTCHPQLVTG